MTKATSAGYHIISCSTHQYLIISAILYNQQAQYGQKLINIAIALASTLISTTAFASLQRADVPLHSVVVSCSAPSRTPARGCQSSRFSVGLFMAEDPEVKKEGILDRITGPKLFKTVTNWNGIHSVPLVPLRILTGLLMIHHGR
jgi:hypothetical protein